MGVQAMTTRLTSTKRRTSITINIAPIPNPGPMYKVTSITARNSSYCKF